MEVALKVEGNSTKLTFNITSNSTTTTYVRFMSVNLIIYNADYFNRAEFASFTLGYVSGQAPLQYANASTIYEPTVMMGLN
jgi:hypothetical protein